jgi:hypothetical protein
MRKTIFSAILILSTVSCASFMEDFGNGEYNDALMQTAVILALASATPAVRNDYLLSAYYYPPLMLDHYVPPDIWKAWSPLQRSLWIESAREIDLENYKRELERIKENLIYDLRQEIERAKEED